MGYQLHFTTQAIGDLSRLDKPIAQRILTKLRWLASNTESINHESLTGKLKGYFKLRIGNFRAVYTIDKLTKIIIVHLIGHRNNIYHLK